MDVGLEITTSRNVTLRFDEFPQQARERLSQVIHSATNRLQGLVRNAVPKHSGRLASEITSRVNEYENAIVGIVFVKGKNRNDFAKAAALEYGAHGSAEVKSHQSKLDHYFSRPIDTIQVMVGSHSRKLNIKEHDYLRGPEANVASDVLADMRQALNDVVEQ